MPPKRLARSQGALRKAGSDMIKASPGSTEKKAVEKTPVLRKGKATNSTLPSKADSAKLSKLLEDIFKCYDQDEDGRIERVEWLDTEEKRLGKLNFGPKIRKASVAWFKEAGAEGTPLDGMYLSFDNFKTAYVATCVQESGIPESEPVKLSEWITEEKAQGLQAVCRRSRPSSRQNASELIAQAAPLSPPTYPLKISFKDVLSRFEEARKWGKMVLVLQSGTDSVETYLKYRNYVPIDSMQVLSEMSIKKTKSKEECAAEVGKKLRTAVHSNSFCRPLWIHMGGTAFDWNGFCCEQFPDEVFSGSRWTLDNVFKRGMIDDMEKLILECDNEKKWQDFQVIITSRFDLEGAETHLKDKIPFYDELAILVVDPASVE